jgi:hypothetical protein
VWPHLGEIALANDWDYYLQLHWAAVYTIEHFHQLPLWNPYRCGGMPLLGHPQSALVSPFLPLDLILGPMVAIHLQVVIHLAIAFGGGCVLARCLGISRLGAIAAAGCFAGSSWFYIHLAAGNADFMAYAYVPWAAAFYYLSIQSRRATFGALAGLVLALMYFERGIYAVPQTALILTLIAATLALQRRSLYPVMILALIGVWTVGFAAIKLLPTLDFFGPGGRAIDPGEANPLWIFIPALFSRYQWGGQILKGHHPWGFHEYGAYIGIIFGTLGLCGITCNFRRGLPWLIVCLATLSLAVGYFGPYSPWVLVHKLPPFYSERVPSRFLILFTLSVGILAGYGIDTLSKMALPWSLAAAIVLVGIAIIDGWFVSASYMHEVVEGGQSPKPWFATFTQTSEPHTGGHAMYMASNSNLGVTVACNDSIPHKFNVHGYEDADYRGEQYLLGAGDLSLTKWTPNALGFEVDAPSPTVLVVNQNYDPDWQVVNGRGEVFNNAGLIAVHIPAGHQQLELAFRSRAFWIGLALTLTTLLALLVLCFTERRSIAATEIVSLGPPRC